MCYTASKTCLSFPPPTSFIESYEASRTMATTPLEDFEWFAVRLRTPLSIRVFGVWLNCAIIHNRYLLVVSSPPPRHFFLSRRWANEYVLMCVCSEYCETCRFQHPPRLWLAQWFDSGMHTHRRMVRISQATNDSHACIWYYFYHSFQPNRIAYSFSFFQPPPFLPFPFLSFVSCCCTVQVHDSHVRRSSAHCGADVHASGRPWAALGD